MKEESILKTGLRLLVILEVLFEHESTKSEITQVFREKYKIREFSGETLKLDINTLIKAGFNVKRIKSGNKIRFTPDENFIPIKLTFEDVCFLKVIKKLSIELLNYKQILHLQSFFKRIAPFIKDNNAYGLYDFGFFNLVNRKIVEEIEALISKKESCILIYDSPSRGKTEIPVLPVELIYKNKKLYLKAAAKKYNGTATFRIDNIKGIKTIEHDFDFIEFSPNKQKPPILYTISKAYYENFPLEKDEKAIIFDDDKVVIETDENDSFFVIQRLLTIGKNVLSIDNKRIKNKIIENLEQTLEVYNKCHLQ